MPTSHQTVPAIYLGMSWHRGHQSLQDRWDAADTNDAGDTNAMNMWRYLRVSSVCRATVSREQPPLVLERVPTFAANLA